MNLFELSAKISVDDSAFKKSMENAQKVSKNVATAMQQLQSPLDKAKSGFNAIAHPIETAKANFEKLKNATEAMRHPIETFKNKVADASTALETKRNKLSTLAAGYDSAKKKVDDLTKEFNKSAKESGTSSKKTQELAKKLNEAEKAAEEAKKELDDYSASVSKAGKNSDSASKSVGNFASKLGKGLATAGKVAGAALGVAAAGVTALTTQAVNSFAEYEQLAGGAQKIFDEMDYSKIATDANNAYKELGLSANQYLAVINDVGATFAATMGDEAGYEAAKTGLKAISDYASGTGKNVDELSQKFTMITRSTSSYQSIADQFSGILPATSKDFLAQAQAAGFLSTKYRELTKVPIAEYQQAVSLMLEKGVADLGLANNTMNEAFSTLSGSLSMAKGAWSNLVTGLADDSADLDMLIGNFVESVGAVATQLIPKIGTALSGIGQLVENLAPIIGDKLPAMISSVLPSLLSAAVSLVTSVFNALPSLIQSMLPIVIDSALSVAMAFIDTVVQNAGMFVQVGINAIIQIVNGISQSMPQIISAAIAIVSEMFLTLTDTQNLESMLEAAMTLIESIVTGLIDNIPKLVSAAIEIVDNLVWFVTQPNNLEKLLAMALKLVITVMNGLIDAIPQLTTAAIQLIMQLVNFVLDPSNISMLLNMSLEIVLAIVDGLLAASGELINGAVELITELCNTFLETDWAQIGSDIINTLLSGLQSAWESVASWFNGVWDSLFGNRSVDVNANVTGGVSTDGSHAGGLAYVPFDGYIAELHKGERVLTADEARGYNNRSNSGYDERPIKIVVQSVLDGKVIGETAYNYNRRRARAGGT